MDGPKCIIIYSLNYVQSIFNYMRDHNTMINLDFKKLCVNMREKKKQITAAHSQSGRISPARNVLVLVMWTGIITVLCAFCCIFHVF